MNATYLRHMALYHCLLCWNKRENSWKDNADDDGEVRFMVSVHIEEET